MAVWKKCVALHIVGFVTRLDNWEEVHCGTQKTSSLWISETSFLIWHM